MSTPASLIPSFRLIHHLCTRRRSLTPIFSPYPLHLSIPQGSSPRVNVKHKVKIERNASNNSQPESSHDPARPPSSEWKNWILGIMLSMILPFFKHKGGPFMAFKNRVDMAIETVESVAEVVEEVGEAVKKVADEIEDKLPEDTMLKESICLIEDLAEEAVEKARQAEEIIHKVEEVEKELEKTLMDQEKLISRKKPEDNVDEPVKRSQ